MDWVSRRKAWRYPETLFETYLDDIRWLGKRYYTPKGIAAPHRAKMPGIFTVQYPEEKLPVPEEFRFIPFLLYEEKDGEKARPLHLLRYLRQGLPAAVHLDRAHQ
jgi:NADH-quinone oxidoreductase subunit I